jgi:hypothetical protein
VRIWIKLECFYLAAISSLMWSNTLAYCANLLVRWIWSVLWIRPQLSILTAWVGIWTVL